MSGTYKIALIAAMEREVLPLIRAWKQIDAPQGSNLQQLWTKGEVVLACAGIGPQRAELTTNVLIEAFHPELITSIGFAGAVVPELKVGNTLIPASVISIATGECFRSELGCGILATSEVLLGSSQKKNLPEVFNAQAVDMEAAAVARVAARHKIRFRAIKAISDDLTDVIEITAPFIEPGTDGKRGRFQTREFVRHIVVRPWLWGKVMRLAKNSRKASEALCAEVSSLVNDPQIVTPTVVRGR